MLSSYSTPPPQHAPAAGTGIREQVGAGSADPPPPTPVARRAWEREAVRVVRLAVTGYRSVRTRYSDACEAGQRALNLACNTILEMCHLPALPLGVLAEVPDLRTAAAGKLARAARRHMRELHACVAELQALTQEAREHAGSIDAVLHQAWQAADPHTLVPGLGASRAAALLRQLSAQLDRDTADRVGVAAAAARQVAAHTREALPAGEHPSPALLPSSSVEGVEAALLSEQLTARSQVWLSVWLIGPHYDKEREEAVISTLVDALAAAG